MPRLTDCQLEEIKRPSDFLGEISGDRGEPCAEKSIEELFLRLGSISANTGKEVS